MSREDIESLHPRLLRPGMWEFTHHDGRTEEIRLREREDPMTERTYLHPVTNWPDMHIEEMLRAGRFTRFLGP